MYIELIGGALDGKRLQLDNPNVAVKQLKFRNPKVVKFNSQLCEPLILTRVSYIRSHVLNETVYYKFDGYIE